jgi:hypothetical protein
MTHFPGHFQHQVRPGSLDLETSAMNSFFARLGVVTLVLLFVTLRTEAQPTLQMQFGAQGPSSIRYGNNELLANGRMEVRQRALFPGQIISERPSPGEPLIGFDASANRLREIFSWGSISCVYRVAGDRIYLDVAVTNTGKDAIRLIDIALMKLRLPGWNKSGDWDSRWPQPINTADDPQIFPINYSTGTMLFCGEEVDQPLGLHVLPGGEKDDCELVLRWESFPHMGSLIGPQDTNHFKLSVRFGPRDADPIALAEDIYQRFAQRYPRQMKWDDHRPIGSMNLSSSAMGIKKNPRGWFMERYDLDVTTPQGVEAFHKRLLKYADTCVGFAKGMNAQGVIVWDIEGQEMPHMISYIGDPRLMDQMAPEMSGVADAFMQKFKDAGLRVGVTIRPSHVVHSPGNKEPWTHIQADDPVEEISEKIEYAKKRWGCTLFYVDSTTLWETEPDGSLQLKIMPAEFFRILNNRFPDSLLIPEESATRHWAYAAPYHELQQGYTETPASVRAVYPDAFTVLRVVDAGMDLVRQKHDALVAGVRSGDILLYRTWFNDEYDNEVKRIYQDAKINP